MRLNLKGVTLPTLGYGCYGLSGAYGKAPDDATAVRLLQCAYDRGLRYFDTASSYGRTEQLLAKAFKALRTEVFIATKVSPTKGEQPRLDYGSIIAACESSLRNLETEYIDLYQVHYHDPRTEVAETISALSDLKHQGKIRDFGIGHLPLSITREYLSAGKAAAVLVEMNAVAMSRYSEVYPFTEQSKASIVAFSPTARGLLTGQFASEASFASSDIRSLDPQFRRSKLTMGIKMAEQLKHIGSRFGKTSCQIALAWVMRQPGVDVVLTGPKDPEHLQENCEVLNWRLDTDTLLELNSIIATYTSTAKLQIEEDITNILHSPLATNKQDAVRDLVYVLEYAAEQNLIPEDECKAIFKELLAPSHCLEVTKLKLLSYLR